MKCEKGEIYWIDFSSAQGAEIKGKHPALVIQNSATARSENLFTITVSALTSKKIELLNKLPFCVFLPKGEANLPKDSIVNLTQTFSIDKSRLESKLGRLSKEYLEQINEAIRIHFDV